MNKPAISKSLINGVSSDFLNVNDRSIHYGDGVFETILCNSRRLFYWQQHYQRLKLSADKLKISCPSEAIFLADITKLLDGNAFVTSDDNETAFTIKIILTRGDGERGYLYPQKNDSNRIVLISSLDKAYSSLLSNTLLSGDLCFCQQQVSINKNLAGLKHLNRLENVMARNEWGTGSSEANIIDGLMLNANQHVIEGCMSNLFAIKNNTLLTPDLSLSGVNGVMREVIINLANDNNIDFTISDLNQKDLYAMDGLFISNSLIGMKAIIHLDNTAYEQLEMTTTVFDLLIKSMHNNVQIT
jgi:4-amino-4-deoxychorismate lyase